MIEAQTGVTWSRGNFRLKVTFRLVLEARWRHAGGTRSRFSPLPQSVVAGRIQALILAHATPSHGASPTIMRRLFNFRSIRAISERREGRHGGVNLEHRAQCLFQGTQPGFVVPPVFQALAEDGLPHL